MRWYLYSLVSPPPKDSGPAAGAGRVDSPQMNHNFALSTAIGADACSIKQPAKNSAIPSKSSRLVTLDTSTAHQKLSCSLVIARRLLTLIRSHNDDCAHIGVHTVLFVRVTMTGVVVVIIHERLVKICRIVSAMIDQI